MVGIPEKRVSWFGANKKDGIRKGAVSFLENLDVKRLNVFEKCLDICIIYDIM